MQGTRSHGRQSSKIILRAGHHHRANWPRPLRGAVDRTPGHGWSRPPRARQLFASPSPPSPRFALHRPGCPHLLGEPPRRLQGLEAPSMLLRDLTGPASASAAHNSSDRGTRECFYTLSSSIAQISDSYSGREALLLLGRKRSCFFHQLTTKFASDGEEATALRAEYHPGLRWRGRVPGGGRVRGQRGACSASTGTHLPEGQKMCRLCERPCVRRDFSSYPVVSDRRGSS